ncbi:hypothetical protein GUJ93_ZPchr0015g6676 [Zizania palustris]|uniref:Uncharacterized protein n=1 Tax=Zizania palustris TaxID=103762 RepID=A0A8J5T8V7_ZIZPA|nr:hypothetical protein GUJ93_ZPchr0015g6676 [Zizania palustris]
MDPDDWASLMRTHVFNKGLSEMRYWRECEREEEFKRREEAERKAKEERETDRERKHERARRAYVVGPKAVRKGSTLSALSRYIV